MTADVENLRREVLPWHGEAVTKMYVSAKALPYGEGFAFLMREAYHSYLAACPRASVITSGEALLRAIYDKIAKRLIQQGELSLRHTRNKNITLNSQNKEHIYFLSDYLTFDQAIRISNQELLFSDQQIKNMLVVKSLRNDAAHGEFPVLDYWDPDDPRPEDKFLAFMRGEISISEGYRFIPSRGDKAWFNFACRDYNCGSMSQLSVEDRFAAIQLSLVFKLVSELAGPLDLRIFEE